MTDGELPADILEQYPALEPPPDPNRVAVVWMLGVIVLAFGFMVLMGVTQIQRFNAEHPTATPIPDFEHGCFVRNTGDEPVNIYAAPDTQTTLVGRIAPGDVRRVVQQGTNWHSIDSTVTPDWVQADQVELVGDSCEQ